MSLKPIEKVIGSFVSQIIVDKTKFLYFIWLKFDRLDESFEASIRNIIFIEAYNFYMRLKVLVFNEGTYAFNAPIKDTVAWKVEEFEPSLLFESLKRRDESLIFQVARLHAKLSQGAC